MGASLQKITFAYIAEADNSRDRSVIEATGQTLRSSAPA